jgi:hypothetical protein
MRFFALQIGRKILTRPIYRAKILKSQRYKKFLMRRLFCTAKVGAFAKAQAKGTWEVTSVILLFDR